MSSFRKVRPNQFSSRRSQSGVVPQSTRDSSTESSLSSFSRSSWSGVSQSTKDVNSLEYLIEKSIADFVAASFAISNSIRPSAASSFCGGSSFDPPPPCIVRKCLYRFCRCENVCEQIRHLELTTFFFTPCRRFGTSRPKFNFAVVISASSASCTSRKCLYKPLLYANVPVQILQRYLAGEAAAILASLTRRTASVAAVGP